MVHSDEAEFAKTDKTVILKKDRNPTLKNYYDEVRVFAGM
jgi:hypothetical protein